MQKTLTDFFTDNDVRIGEDFQSSLPIYYQSLNEGFYNYFQTIKYRKQSITLLIFSDDISRESVGFSFNDSSETVSTILNLHRFFELFLKDILGRIDPFLAVKFLENEKQVINYLNNSLSPDNVQTIEFSETFKRFKAALSYSSENPENEKYQLAQKFRFLTADDTLEQLARWRNRIIHNGKKLPNILALDFLVTQRIMPFVDQILKIEKEYIKDYVPHYFSTPTGINILERFLKIKFDYKDFYISPRPDNLCYGLLEIAHLKELARARSDFDMYLLNNHSYVEPYYDNPKERGIRLAAAEKEHEHFFSVKSCPCCGFNSLVIYKKITPDIFNNGQDMDYFFSRCFSCNYLLPENMGEPFRFKLYPERLFHPEMEK